MPRTEQAPRAESWTYGDRRFFHAYTDEGIRRVENGFVLRITQPEKFKDSVFRNELGNKAIYAPYTGNTAKHIEDDIRHSVLDDRVVDNLIFNLNLRRKEHENVCRNI